MRKNENKLVLFARIFLFVIYFVGLTGISLPSLREVYVELTPVSLLISLLILLAFHSQWDIRSAILFAGIALAGYGLEVAGVQTGAIFGVYSYGPVLGFSMAGVPLIIGLNWLILIYLTYYLAGRIVKQPILKVLAAAFLMVLFDLLMEPVAVHLGMWQWAGEGIPHLNYAAWFVISLVFAGAIHWSGVKLNNPVAGALLLYMTLFFGLLNVTL